MIGRFIRRMEFYILRPAIMMLLGFVLSLGSIDAIAGGDVFSARYWRLYLCVFYGNTLEIFCFLSTSL